MEAETGGAAHRSGVGARSRAEAEQLFIDNVELIRTLIRDGLRRSRLPESERDDFESLAWLHLIRDDYRVLRDFRGTSSLATYLRTVLCRLLMDFRTSRLGKWRPSARARRAGTVAVAFERLVARDGYSPDEACERLSTILGRDAAPDTAMGRRNTRPRLREVPDADLDQFPSHVPGPDVVVDRSARQHAARRVAGALYHALGELAVHDLELLRCRFSRGLSVADTARCLQAPQKPLYRKLDALQMRLRVALEGHGICRGAVRAVTGSAESLLPEIL